MTIHYMPGTYARLVVAVLLLASFALAPSAVAQKKNESNTRAIEGQVVDKGNNPIPKAIVYLKDAKTLQMRTYIADDTGSFHFRGLSPNNDYEIHAEHDGTSSSVRTISSFDSRKEINVTLKIDKK